MDDRHRTKDELIGELASLRRRVAELEGLHAEQRSANKAAKRAEEALQLCEARWHSLVDDATDTISIVDQAGKFLFTNRTPPGRSPTDTLGSNAFGAFAAPYREIARRAVERVFDTGTGDHFEAEGCGVSGYPGWCSAKLAPIKRNGQVVAVMLTTSDITERRRAEQELKRNVALNKMRVSVYLMKNTSDLQKVLGSLFEALKEVEVPFDECSVQIVDEARDTFATAWQAPHGRGYSGTEREMPIPLTKTPVYEAWRKGEVVYRRDLQEHDRYGERLTVSNGLGDAIRSVVDIPFSHGTIAVNSRLPNAFADTHIEVLKRVARVLSEAYTRAEDIRRLEQSEEKYRTVVEYANEAIVVAQDGVLKYANPKTVEVTGYSREELASIPFADYIHPEERDTVIERHNRRLRGEHFDEVYPFRIIDRNGRTKWLESSAVLIEWEGSPATLNFLTEITKRKEAEERLRHYSDQLEEMVTQRTAELRETQDQLVRQEKLATVGQLAAGVSHDLRSPLTAISNAAYYLQTAVGPASEPVKECVDIIGKEVENARRIVLDLLDFSRVERVEREKVSVADVVAGALRNAPLPAKVKVATKLQPDLPDLFVDGRKMERALGNLLLNAHQAMPKGGRVTITAQLKKGEVLICVHDTGCGIPQEHLEKVFEPLFTTRPKGIGLGLSICKNLINANRGTITVESKEGKGTTFRVHLPIVQPQS